MHFWYKVDHALKNSGVLLCSKLIVQQTFLGIIPSGRIQECVRDYWRPSVQSKHVLSKGSIRNRWHVVSPTNSTNGRNYFLVFTGAYGIWTFHMSRGGLPFSLPIVCSSENLINFSTLFFELHWKDIWGNFEWGLC